MKQPGATRQPEKELTYYPKQLHLTRSNQAVREGAHLLSETTTSNQGQPGSQKRGSLIMIQDTVAESTKHTYSGCK
jgi:hypothetical protein